MDRFVSVSELLADAEGNRHAVAAMNANGATYDIARAILEAAHEEDAPIIIGAYEHNIRYRGMRYFVELVEHLAHTSAGPVAIALDHGLSPDSVMEAAGAGFTGVMLDNTAMSDDDYTAACIGLIDRLGPMGVSFEAEVGRMARQEDLDAATGTTRPEDAEVFLRDVPADLLAVSVGTSHGIHEKQDDVDFGLIREIRRNVGVPLVMHGTSGVSLSDLSAAARAGMRKINFGEGFRVDYIRHFQRLSNEIDHHCHAWAIMEEVKNALKADMRRIIRALG